MRSPDEQRSACLFRKTGALLDGHFVLRSGLHSREYFQCALLLQHTDVAAKVCGWLADKMRQFDCDAVISPALGGIIVGQEVGRSLGKRHIFVEKDEGKLVLRRGFQISPNEKFVVVEDVVTRGGRVQETIDIVQAASTAVFSIFREVTPLVEPLSLDEAYLDVTENAWGEALATAVARRLKQRIRDDTGLTASAGAAPNKFLAKIASGWKRRTD